MLNQMIKNNLAKFILGSVMTNIPQRLVEKAHKNTPSHKVNPKDCNIPQLLLCILDWNLAPCRLYGMLFAPVLHCDIGNMGNVFMH